MNKLDGIKPGDRVRVTQEGVVEGVAAGHVTIGFDGALAASTINPRSTLAPTFQIERIEPPLKVGDRVRRKSGAAAEYEVVAVHGDVVIVWRQTGSDGYATDYLASTLERIA